MTKFPLQHVDSEKGMKHFAISVFFCDGKNVALLKSYHLANRDVIFPHKKSFADQNPIFVGHL